MTAKRKPGRFKLAAAVSVVAGLAAGTAAIIAGSSPVSAVPVSKTLNYSCVFPIIGAQPIAVTINSDMPTSVEAGDPTDPFQINAVTVVNDASRAGLRIVGGVSLEGTVAASANLAAPNLNLPLTVPLTIPRQPIPEATGPFNVNANGSTPSLTFGQNNVGTATITVGDLLLTLTPRDAAGNPTTLGTFDSQCTQAPGQNNTLHTFQITGGGGSSTTSSSTSSSSTSSTSSTSTSTTSTTVPGPLKFAFDITGNSFIAAPNGNVPIVGDIKVDFNLSTGNFTSTLTLNPTAGNFNILGFLPVTTQIEFVQTAPTTGSLAGGRLTSHSTMHVKLTNVLAFGILPIGGGPNCQTATPATVDLATPEGETFNPLQGGNLSGTYTLPALGQAATNCGFLGDIISLFMAGPNNTLDLALAGGPA